MQPLPLGRSSFTTLRAKDEIYVDKTKWVYQLARFDSKIFLARPRRFGKSLLVSTFESLFRHGVRDFAGLDIEKHWKDRTYPVVRLDFSALKVFRSAEQFRESFNSLISYAFSEVGFQYCNAERRIHFLDQFRAWLRSLAPSSLVILIDEYDAPLTANLDKAEVFSEIRDILSDFYAALKEFEGQIRFFFMTGVTKFSNTSIFSAFNNLQDISLNPVFGTLLGYTETEIQFYFAEYLDHAADLLGATKAEIFQRLKENYDGFSFDMNGQAHVFCPWSVLNFFSYPQMGFLNYWYSSGGQPAALMRYLTNHTMSEPISYAQTKTVRLSELSAACQYDEMSLEALLTQTGYLTIKEVTADQYAVLGYPNQEVALSMAQVYADELLKGKRLRQPGAPALSDVLANGSVENIIEQFNSVVASIDYQRYPIVDEASCRAYLQVLLIGAAMMPHVEVHSALGRSDMEVQAGRRHWVFEFKFARQDEDVQALLEAGKKQLLNRQYGHPLNGSELRRLVLVFSGPKRSFVAWAEVS